MKNHKLVILFSLLISFFVINNCYAQNIRYTSFDNRIYCEQTGGIWRQYGNSCADNCLTDLKNDPICMDVLTYSCDCGNDRCWNNNQCMTIAKYKPIFSHIKDVKMANAKKNENLQLKKSHENADASVFSIPVVQVKKVTKTTKTDTASSSDKKDDKPPVQIALPIKTTPTPDPTTTPTTTDTSNSNGQICSVPPVFQQLIDQKAASKVDSAISNSIINAVGNASQ